MKSYRNTAPSRVLGQEPGTVFDAELDPVQEQRLLAGGHLELVDAKPAKPSRAAARTTQPDAAAEGGEEND